MSPRSHLIRVAREPCLTRPGRGDHERVTPDPGQVRGLLGGSGQAGYGSCALSPPCCGAPTSFARARPDVLDACVPEIPRACLGCRIVVSDLSRQLTHAAVKGGDKKHKLPPSHKRLVDDGVTFTKQLTDMPLGQVRNSRRHLRQPHPVAARELHWLTAGPRARRVAIALNLGSCLISVRFDRCFQDAVGGRYGADDSAANSSCSRSRPLRRCRPRDSNMSPVPPSARSRVVPDTRTSPAPA